MPYGRDVVPAVGGAPLTLRVKQVIENADDRLRSERNYRLRSDAKVMLLLNFTSMIAVPLAIHGDEIAYLGEGLEYDINLLLHAAPEPSDEEGLSAHTLVDTLSRNWQELRLSNVRLWGASRR